MQLENKLLQMKDNYFIHMGNDHKVINFKIIGDTVHLVTDRSWFEIPVNKASDRLKDFIPTEQPKVPVNGTSPVNGNGNMVLYQEVKDANIVGTLIDNIDQLKKGNLDVKKASAINNTVNTLLNAARLEVQIKMGGK